MSGPIWLNGRYCRPVCPEHGYQEEPAPVERSPINWQARAEAAEAQVARLREALEAVPVSASLGKQCKMCGTFAPEALGVSCPRPECEYRARPPKEPSQ